MERKNSVKLILFGEDDIDDQELLRESLNSVDPAFSMQFVITGRKLLSELDNLPGDQLPCLIVLDYNMPEMNGAEILQLLKKNHRYDSIPKIVWSTSRSDSFKNICLDCGANDYIVKPSSVKELTEALRHMLSFC